MWDFLFMDEDSIFFVECDTLKEAWGIVRRYISLNCEVEYLGAYTPEEAEILGYDTY